MNLLTAAQRDWAGTLCSGLCLSHCLLTPLLLASGALGTLGAALATETIHWALLAPVLLFAVLSFPAGVKHHGRYLPAMIAGAGLLLLLLALLAGETLEAWLTAAGALAMWAAHGLNRRWSRG
ncbi:hypothetical protein GCM10011297_32680 [Bacterioplanes sanyensis]|uniref:MerC domain-containing protein n=1 Tax=Bacterioplanes sanyensis TaxID=1249553 RepID=UPI0016756BD4|nr:MerC domain-containing protein [Bacterioplanes sanyensis]GGY57500.1 hypothetical protein GCM10011297_32680 [Bacterioplanes sanyensis]